MESCTSKMNEFASALTSSKPAFRPPSFIAGDGSLPGRADDAGDQADEDETTSRYGELVAADELSGPIGEGVGGR